MAETEKPSLKEQVALLPLSPGVYQFVDLSGTIIYVGKAKSLRKRHAVARGVTAGLFLEGGFFS